MLSVSDNEVMTRVGPREGKLQDIAMMESMGAVFDRTEEHLGRSDGMIIAVRTCLINAAKRLQDEAALHATIDDATLYHVRPAAVVLPEGIDWFEATKEQRRSNSGLELAHVVKEYAGVVYGGGSIGRAARRIRAS